MITNWFQTQQAYDLFEASCGEMRPIRVQMPHCRCVMTIMGGPLSRRGIVQGGIEVNDGEDANGELISEIKELLVRVREEGRKAGCAYVEIRNFNAYSVYKDIFAKAGFCYEPHYEAKIQLMGDKSLDVSNGLSDCRKSQMHESKQRAVKKALAEGQTWHEARNEQEIRDFYVLLRKLYRTKVHRPIPGRNFFLTAWRMGVKVLIVRDKQEQIIGGVLMPVDNETCYEWYICGGVMSTWAMMEYAVQHGIQTIDLMGAGKPNVPYGVREFKVQMGAELNEWGRFLWVNKPCVYRLGKWFVEWKY